MNKKNGGQRHQQQKEFCQRQLKQEIPTPAIRIIFVNIWIKLEWPLGRNLNNTFQNREMDSQHEKNIAGTRQCESGSKFKALPSPWKNAYNLYEEAPSKFVEESNNHHFNALSI